MRKNDQSENFNRYRSNQLQQEIFNSSSSEMNKQQLLHNVNLCHSDDTNSDEEAYNKDSIANKEEVSHIDNNKFNKDKSSSEELNNPKKIRWKQQLMKSRSF